MPFSDEEVFHLTKLLYRQIHQNFTQNYIGEKQALEQFQENYIQPLYPSKKIQEEQPPDETLRGKISQYRHKYDQQIEFSQGQSQSEESEDSSRVSYVSAVQRYSVKDLLCKLRVGRFFCWKSTPPDHVYEDLGLGICLYLKFMKHLVFVLLLLTVLSIVTMSIFYSVAQSNKYQPGLNYQKVLFSLGVGSLSLEEIKCIHENITATPIVFDLACPVGFVRVLAPVYTQNSFETLQSCKKDAMAFVEQDQDLFLPQDKYFHFTDCNLQQSNCTYNVTLASPNTSYAQLSVPYECINGHSTYGAIQITRSTALYINVVFDLIMVVSLMLFFWSQNSAEKKEEKYFKEKQILLNAFTLEISSFSKRNFNQEFIQFITDVEKQIKREDNLQVNLRKCIIQVRLPDNDEYDRDQAKRQSAYRDIYAFIGEYFIQKNINPSSFDTVDNFKKMAFRSEGAFKSYRRKLGELLKEYRKMQKLKGKNHEEQLKVYVVFLKPKYKRLVMEKTRVVLGRQVLETEKKDYEVVDPPAPSLILWDNIGKNKLVRGIISWVLSLIILFGTYVLTAYILNLQNNVTVGQYDFNIECQNSFPDENYSQFNQNYYTLYKLSYTHCYCLNRSIIFSLNFQPVCAEWRDQYTLFLAIPVLYGLGLFVMNEIVSAIYRKLSEFQAHQYLTSELYSYIIKQTILETTDLALVIVLLSIDFNKKSTTFDFLLIGSYDDVSADWHLEVGIIIIVNMFFNMFSPFIEGIFYLGESLIRKIKLCLFHRRATFNKTKMNYIQHYRENVFPIEERYASILAVMFISLTLNCVYPIMTVIMAVTLLLYQLMDKLMIIKVYHKPLNFEGLLQKKIMKVLLIILLLHIAITAVFLTEPFLVVAGEASNEGSILQVGTSRVDHMFKVGYVVPYMILLVVIVLSIFVIYVSDRLFITKPNPRVRLGLGGIPFQENKFYNLLDAYELDRTIALKRREIQRNKILQKKYMKKFTPQQDEQENMRKSDPNKPIIPTKRRDLILSLNKPILSEISEYAYYRLLKKKLKTSKEQEKLVKLAGMTAYEWQEDWIYFDQQVRLDYKVPQVDSYLNELSRQAQSRVQLIRTIIDMARNHRLKSAEQAQNKQEIKEIHEEIKEEQNFEEIINQSNVTSSDLQHQTDSLEITNTYLPILALERQLQQMQEKARQPKVEKKSSQQQSRQIMLMKKESKASDGIDNNRNEKRSDELRNSRRGYEQEEKSKPNLPNIFQLKEEDQMYHSNKNALEQNQIKLKIFDTQRLMNKIRPQSSSQQSIQLQKKHSNSHKNPEQPQRLSKREFIEDFNEEEHPIVVIDDKKEIGKVSEVESQVMNTSEEEDNQNQKVLEPDQQSEVEMIDHVIEEENYDERRRQRQSQSQNKGNFYLNQLPSEKILFEPQNDREIKLKKVSSRS